MEEPAPVEATEAVEGVESLEDAGISAAEMEEIRNHVQTLLQKLPFDHSAASFAVGLDVAALRQIRRTFPFMDDAALGPVTYRILLALACLRVRRELSEEMLLEVRGILRLAVQHRVGVHEWAPLLAGFVARLFPELDRLPADETDPEDASAAASGVPAAPEADRLSKPLRHYVVRFLRNLPSSLKREFRAVALDDVLTGRVESSPAGAPRPVDLNPFRPLATAYLHPSLVPSEVPVGPRPWHFTPRATVSVLTPLPSLSIAEAASLAAAASAASSGSSSSSSSSASSHSSSAASGGGGARARPPAASQDSSLGDGGREAPWKRARDR